MSRAGYADQFTPYSLEQVHGIAVSFPCMRFALLLLVLLTLPCSGGSQTPAAPQASPASLQKARDLLQAGKLPEAITALQQLAAAKPPVPGAQHDLGIAFYRSSKLVEAEQAFAAAVREDPADRESLQMQGLTLYRMGQPARAIPLLEQVRSWMPSADADANYVLGLCYLNARRYDDARGAFAAEFSVPPASAPAYLLLSTMLLHAELPELAAEQARKALELDPKLPLGHFRLGEVALYKSDIALATREFELERTLNPGYAPTYDRLGDVYLRSGQYTEAQQVLTKAISLDVTSTGPFIQMGKVLLRREDPTTATLYLRHAEKMDPANYITHTLLAQAYRKTGQADMARHELEVASRLHAEDTPKLPASE